MKDFERAYQEAIYPDPKHKHGRYDIYTSELQHLYEMSEQSSEGLLEALLTAFNYGFIRGEKKAKADERKKRVKA